MYVRASMGNVPKDPQVAERLERNIGTPATITTLMRQNAVIDFMCQPYTTRFENACGCGCEQHLACPDWFDCMPSPGLPACDTNQIKIDCPYSGIAF
jgi:hypothetical protein